MQQLKNVTLSAIAIVDDPAVPKAYFRVVKRNLGKGEVISKDDISTLPEGTLDLTSIYAEIVTISKQVDAFILQISPVVAEIQSQIEVISTTIAGLQAQPAMEDMGGGWTDTLTYIQSSYQNGEIDDVAYDALLGELELGLSQLT